jgi:transposase-like protein
MLAKITVETALNVELDDHLGFERHEQSGSYLEKLSWSRSRILGLEDVPNLIGFKP